MVLLASALSAALLSGPSPSPSPSPPPTFDTASWNKPTDPFRIVGPVHYVGTSELGAYLVSTPEGHVLVDGGLPESAPLIEASIRALGFDPREIRVLLTTQAHFDHVGSLGHFSRLSGARVEVMDGDVSLVESGGRTDYLFKEAKDLWFEAVKVDRTLKDGDTVTVGDVTLTARRTPGHTPGSTTWLATVKEGDRAYLLVFAASTGINAGTRLVDRPSYPGIAEDYARAFEVLESLSPEVFLGSHAGFFSLEAKRAKLAPGVTPHPFVDPEGFRAHVAARKEAYLKQMETERGGRPAP